MAYKNAKDVLPPHLLSQVWEYVQGETLYIPCPGTGRAAWGSRSGARREYEERNRQIRERHAQSASVKELAEEFCLSEDSIRKIL